MTASSTSANPRSTPPSWAVIPVATASSNRIVDASLSGALTASTPSPTGPDFGVSAINRTSADDIQTRAFDKASDLKVETSQRAMHLDARQRRELFQRIDQVLDPEDLESDANLVKTETYVGFLRLVIAERVSRVPAFGISLDGDLLAAWWHVEPEKRLFARFTGGDHIELTWEAKRQTFKLRAEAGRLREKLRASGFPDTVLDGDA